MKAAGRTQKTEQPNDDILSMMQFFSRLTQIRHYRGRDAKVTGIVAPVQFRLRRGVEAIYFSDNVEQPGDKAFFLVEVYGLMVPMMDSYVHPPKFIITDGAKILFVPDTIRVRDWNVFRHEMELPRRTPRPPSAYGYWIKVPSEWQRYGLGCVYRYHLHPNAKRIIRGAIRKWVDGLGME